MKKQIGIKIFIVIIIAIFGIGIYLIVINQETNKSPVEQKSFFAKVTDENLAEPIGIVGYEFGTRNENGVEKYFEDYYYQPFGEDKELILQTEELQGVYANVVGTKRPFIKKVDNEYIVKLWDQSNRQTEELHSLSEKQFNFRFEGVFLSPDNKYVYVATTYNETDWNANQFNYGDLGITTEIVQINIENKQVKKLFKYVGGPEYYSIAYVSNSKLILIKSIAESDWHQYVIFDIEENKIAKEFNEGWKITALSPNGKYFAYSSQLFSKGGDFNPASVRIVDMNSLEEIPIDFVRSFDFGIDETFEDNDWTVYYYLTWGMDNRSLHVLRQSIINDKYSYSIYSINLATENVDILEIPGDYKDIELVGVYSDYVLLRSYSDEGNLISWKLPGEIVVNENDGYGLHNQQIVTSPLN